MEFAQRYKVSKQPFLLQEQTFLSYREKGDFVPLGDIKGSAQSQPDADVPDHTAL